MGAAPVRYETTCTLRARVPPSSHGGESGRRRRARHRRVATNNDEIANRHAANIPAG